MKTLFFIIISIALAGWVFLYGLPEDVTNKAKTAISELKAAPGKIKQTATDFLSTPAEKREKVISQLETKLAEVKTMSTIPKSFSEEAEKLITDLRAKNEDKPNLLSTALMKVAESILPAQFLSSEPINCEQKK